MRRLLPSLAALALLASARATDYPQPAGAEFTHTFPFAMAGQLLFGNGGKFYSGSGTVARPSSVLTAAHNLWDADNGFSTDILFRRALAGDAALSEQYASRIYVLGGYRENARRLTAEDVRTFSYDMGLLVFARPVAGGAYAGWWANPTLLGGRTLALGYGGETHTGDELLKVESTQGYAPTVGAFYENRSLTFESGMSGGPVLGEDTDGKLYVVGVIVAGSIDPIAGGIRILDLAAANFIKRYAK